MASLRRKVICNVRSDGEGGGVHDLVGSRFAARFPSPAAAAAVAVAVAVVAAAFGGREISAICFAGS